MPYTAPARPPATAATVSVSPPRSMTSRSTSAKSRPCRSAHTAGPSVGHTAPLDSVAWSGSSPAPAPTAHRSRCSAATGSTPRGRRRAGRRRPARPAPARGRRRSPRRRPGRRGSAPRCAGRRPWSPRCPSGRSGWRRASSASASRCRRRARSARSARRRRRPTGGRSRGRRGSGCRCPAAGVRPGAEPVEEVGLVEAAALEQRPGDQHGHLRVVGELAGLPAQRATAAHLGLEPRAGPGKRAVNCPAARTRTGAQRVTDGGADQRAGDAVGTVHRGAIQASCNVAAKPTRTPPAEHESSTAGRSACQPPRRSKRRTAQTKVRRVPR